MGLAASTAHAPMHQRSKASTTQRRQGAPSPDLTITQPHTTEARPLIPLLVPLLLPLHQLHAGGTTTTQACAQQRQPRQPCSLIRLHPKASTGVRVWIHTLRRKHHAVLRAQSQTHWQLEEFWRQRHISHVMPQADYPDLKHNWSLLYPEDPSINQARSNQIASVEEINDAHLDNFELASEIDSEYSSEDEIIDYA
jgi:hypothetical protein